MAGTSVHTDLAAAAIVTLALVLATGAISGLVLRVTTVIVAVTNQVHGYAVTAAVKLLFFVAHGS